MQKLQVTAIHSPYGESGPQDVLQTFLLNPAQLSAQDGESSDPAWKSSQRQALLTEKRWTRASPTPPHPHPVLAQTTDMPPPLRLDPQPQEMARQSPCKCQSPNVTLHFGPLQLTQEGVRESHKPPAQGAVPNLCPACLHIPCVRD